jgi:hypothetical protein
MMAFSSGGCSIVLCLLSPLETSGMALRGDLPHFPSQLIIPQAIYQNRGLRQLG